MLNHINKCVYLLKGDVGELGVFLVLGVCREVYGTIGVRREGTPTWDNNYQWSSAAPHNECKKVN